MTTADGALEILSEISGMPKELIRPDMDLVADLDLDSPDALRLIVELEERLSVEISDEDAAKLSTVGDVLAWLQAAEPR